MLFVDDGSTDDTLEKLKCLARTHRQIRVFSFRRNLGKSPALECGFRMATGNYILTMDADLQDDPARPSADVRSPDERALLTWSADGDKSGGTAL